jgi:hypothetical protein
LPYTWTDEELGLLRCLYPHKLSTATVDDDGCFLLDMNDEINTHASQLVTSRAAADTNGYYCLVHLYDSVNHAQERYENVILLRQQDEGAYIYATADITEGLQLFGTYENSTFYHLFHDYGFFSPYPRLWVFVDDEDELTIFEVSLLQDDSGYDYDFKPHNIPRQDNMTYMYHATSNHLSSVLAAELIDVVQHKSSNVNPK